MLQIRNLTISHKKDLRVLLRDFSLLLAPGDKAVLLGEEGNGKSTLLKWIYDPALVQDYAEAEGERVFSGKAAWLPQELSREEKAQSVYAFFSACDAFWDTDPGRLHRLFRELGLPQELCYSEQSMGSLSGGERVKVQMARLKLEQPDLLLLDEPSNDIDLETLAWLEREIRDFPGAVLFISHDETLIERAANRIVLLEQLHHKTISRWSVSNLPYAAFLEARRRGYDKQEQLAVSERREERIALEKFRRIQQRVEHEQKTISRSDPHGGRLLKKKMASVKAMERRYAREHEELTAFPEVESAIAIRFNRAGALPAGRTVLELDLPILYCEDGEGVLARDLRLTVRGPEKLCLIGRNGAGKSTLLRRIARMLAERDNLRTLYMPQEYEELLDPGQTPVEFLVPSGERAAVTEARSCLGSLRFTAQEMERPIRMLSGGQKAKLLLLRLALSEADVLLLDEPTRNFSPLSGPEIRAMLRAFPGAILAISHDRKFIAEVCDRVCRLTPAGLEPVPLPVSSDPV